MAAKKLTGVQLTETLAQMLVSGSLYKNLVYDGTDVNYTASGSQTHARYGQLPTVIRMYCASDDCQQETLWATDKPEKYFAHQFHEARYTCRNCRGRVAVYWLLWTEDKINFRSKFCKVGQYPALSIEPPAELSKALGEEDAALYKKALINGNYAFGIGALAYLRRVIENKLNLMLDLIAEAAKLAAFETEELARISEIKESHHVDTKIEYASKILPPHLRPGGHNPLNKLYAVASAGIHGKSDEQCLEDFQSARFEFEYLFKNLTVNNADANEYLKRLSKPIP